MKPSEGPSPAGGLKATTALMKGLGKVGALKLGRARRLDQLPCHIPPHTHAAQNLVHRAAERNDGYALSII